MQQREEERGKPEHLLSHRGQSALASGFQEASRGGRSHSSWPQLSERQRRIHPGSALHLYQSLTAPFKHTLDSKNIISYTALQQTLNLIRLAHLHAAFAA